MVGVRRRMRADEGVADTAGSVGVLVAGALVALTGSTSADTLVALDLATGKVRWELVNRRAKLGLDGQVAIIALERLYPLPAEELAAELKQYAHVSDIRFVQDEPENQGPWPFLALNLPKAVAEHDRSVDISGWRLFSRPAASAPSVGSYSVHEEQEEELTTSALQD